jgi:3-hydroxyacyl-[acyl-carrier-protein] dehydratase
MPGDQLELKVSIERELRGLLKYAGTALVDGKVAAEATLMCTARDLPAETAQ